MFRASKKIFIASGGTGGHIMPARCLASELAVSGHKVTFFGDKKYAAYVKKEDAFASIIIASSQIKKSPISLMKAVFKIAIGVLQSLYFFLRIRPGCVVTFGGYSTFPILIAAVITRTKIILHEQNAHLGKVNRIFINYSSKVGTSFVQTSGIDAKNLEQVISTGNPVRQEIIALNKQEYALPENEDPKIRTDNKMGYDVLLTSDFYEEEKPKKMFNILVIGGSGGAKIFSEILPKAFFNLSEEIKSNIQIVQQCRRELVRSTFDQYSAFNINIIVDAFFEDMPHLISEAHLVIARSGSSSIFEFCAAKKPMILVPFAQSADDHQEKNAAFLEMNGAAVVIREDEFGINHVSDVLKELMSNPDILHKMSKNAADSASLDATSNLAEVVLSAV